MCLIDFWNFLTIHVFEVKESIADISTELPCLGDLENPGRLPGSTRTRRYWWLCLVEFWNFFTIYVFEVREFFAGIPTELQCSGDLENSGHLPVQEVFEVTQTFVPWQKCSKFISIAPKTRDGHTINALLSTLMTTLLSCHVMSRHVTSCPVTPRHVTSCHVMWRHVTSCHVMPRYVTSCHVLSRHVPSCHVMSRHVTSCHVMPYHAMSRRKSRDGYTTNALLPTDSFHKQSN